ncbi:helix-hairpin-helix domain-containing protein [Brucella abortus]|nr:helix-hairpin-helix domain-containing protein [Brucella abortus]
MGASLAEAIVAHRDAAGAFKNRKELLKVARLGNRTFEQCAGFLRIPNGDEPLDASAVHPEAYGVAKEDCCRLRARCAQPHGRQRRP